MAVLVKVQPTRDGIRHALVALVDAAKSIDDGRMIHSSKLAIATLQAFDQFTAQKPVASPQHYLPTRFHGEEAQRPWWHYALAAGAGWYGYKALKKGKYI